MVQIVRAEVGIVPSEIHLIKRGTLPKTSSGKVRRREAKRRLALGELEFLTDADSKADSLPPSAMMPSYSNSVAGPEATDGIQ